MATHSSILAWRLPMARRAWQATAHGVTKSQTRLSDFHFHSLKKITNSAHFCSSLLCFQGLLVLLWLSSLSPSNLGRLHSEFGFKSLAGSRVSLGFPILFPSAVPNFTQQRLGYAHIVFCSLRWCSKSCRSSSYNWQCLRVNSPPVFVSFQKLSSIF